MLLDMRSVALVVGDSRLLILYLLGYASCVGMLCLLCKRVNQKVSIKVNTETFKYLVAGEYAVSLVIGSAFWYVFATHPALLWIPISLFLIISL